MPLHREHVEHVSAAMQLNLRHGRPLLTGTRLCSSPDSTQDQCDIVASSIFARQSAVACRLQPCLTYLIYTPLRTAVTACRCL